MERTIVFSGIRKRQFPKKWHSTVEKLYPQVHTLLVSMLSHIPVERPTAIEVVTTIEVVLSEYTVYSLAKSEGSIFVRVEAKNNEGILDRTMELIKNATSRIEILQFSLRGQGSKAIMEFEFESLPPKVLENDELLDSDTEANPNDDLLSIVFKTLEACPEINLYRILQGKNISS